MAVSGVRNSWVTESSKAERSCSLSRAASARAQFFDRSGALDRDRDQTAHGFQRLAGKQRAGNAHAADHADTQPERHEHGLFLGVGFGFAPHAD